MRTIPITYLLLGALLGMHLDGPGARGADDLKRPATWSVPPATQVREAVDQWVAAQPADPEVAEQVHALWENTEASDPASTVERIVHTARLMDPRGAQLATMLDGPVVQWSTPDETLFQDDTIPQVIRNNLQLAYGIWLTKGRLYDEAREQLTALTPEDVADPAALLFYTGATHYRLRDKEGGLAALQKLLEREQTIPVRFATVARLMHAELAAFEPDSLDEVARLMDSIQVRLGHGRAGKRVRTEEDEVIAKLDKMIEELEKQRQQQQQAAAGGNGGQNSQPLQDSALPGMQSAGDVDGKEIEGPIDWGNLPPAQRQEALQQLSKQFPSHYREVIEEYFRDLARKEIDNP